MLVSFLTELYEHGRVRVDAPDAAVAAADLHGARQLLLEIERVVRQDFPGDPPTAPPEVVEWAALSFYHACQAAVFRDLDAVQVEQLLASSCPPAEAASRHYAADLTFRFLPDLITLAEQAAPGDALLEILRRWANEWPLSSVGVPKVVPVSLAGIVEHPAMLRYYVDRVIARRDVSRLSDPHVRSAVGRSLTLYEDRFPELGTHASCGRR